MHKNAKRGGNNHRLCDHSLEMRCNSFFLFILAASDNGAYVSNTSKTLVSDAADVASSRYQSRPESRHSEAF